MTQKEATDLYSHLRHTYCSKLFADVKSEAISVKGRMALKGE